MPDSEAKIRWGKENMMMLCLKLHRKKDMDVIEFLESKGTEKQKAIKLAIREYMANHPDED